MKNLASEKERLIKDCRAKFRQAEIEAEHNSIKKIDQYNSMWKHL